VLKGDGMPKKANGASKKTHLTLKLDTELLRVTKVVAAKRGTSMSALMVEALAEVVRKDNQYKESMKRSTARMKKG